MYEASQLNKNHKEKNEYPVFKAKLTCKKNRITRKNQKRIKTNQLHPEAKRPQKNF